MMLDLSGKQAINNSRVKYMLLLVEAYISILDENPDDILSNNVSIIKNTKHLLDNNKNKDYFLDQEVELLNNLINKLDKEDNVINVSNYIKDNIIKILNLDISELLNYCLKQPFKILDNNIICSETKQGIVNFLHTIYSFNFDYLKNNNIENYYAKNDLNYLKFIKIEISSIVHSILMCDQYFTKYFQDTNYLCIPDFKDLNHIRAYLICSIIYYSY